MSMNISTVLIADHVSNAQLETQIQFTHTNLSKSHCILSKHAPQTIKKRFYVEPHKT